MDAESFAIGCLVGGFIVFWAWYFYCQAKARKAVAEISDVVERAKTTMESWEPRAERTTRLLEKLNRLIEARKQADLDPQSGAHEEVERLEFEINQELNRAKGE